MIRNVVDTCVFFSFLWNLNSLVTVLFVGIACCAIALFKGYYLYLIEKKGKTISAKILNYQLDILGNIIPVVEFSCEGRIVRSIPFYFSLARFFNSRMIREMAKNNLNVAYWPDNPEKFILTAEKRAYYYFKIIYWVFTGAAICTFSIVAMLTI